MPQGENLTQALRSRGGQASIPPEPPSREQSQKGGRNSSTTFEEGNEYGSSDFTWHRDRNAILQEYPGLWEEYSDEPPKHPGGEVNERVEGLLDE